MVGYHVNWRDPERFSYRDWEILLQILSARMWQEKFGPIKLSCDQATYEMYSQIGVSQIYDDVEVFDQTLLAGIDPKIYFAAGKILAQLQAPEEKCAFIDTDLLIYGPNNFYDDSRVTVFHREFPHSSIYANFWDRWHIDLPVNELVYPLNCALVIWPEKDLRRNYAAHAMKFMRNNDYYGKHKANTLMVTAEQRLLGLYLHNLGIEPDYYIKDIYMSSNTKSMGLDWITDEQGTNLDAISNEFFHTWGFKHNLAADPMVSAEYTLRLFNLLEKYPEIDTEKILQKLKKI